MKSLLFIIALNCILGQPDVNEMVKQHLLDHERLHSGVKKRLVDANVDFAWRPIRIYIEFLDEYDAQWKEYVSRVLEVSRTFLGKHLLIRYQGGAIQYGNGSTQCIGEEIPENLATKDYDYDMVFFTKILNDTESSYLAYAGPCSIQLLDNRPIFGGIVWNMHYTDLDNLSPIKFENSVSTAIHEIIHGLGFISALYPYFIDHNTMKSYDNVTYYDDLNRLVLNTPRLTNISRNYFNCYNANGTMENEGSSATQESHFERTVFFNEIMTGSSMQGDFIVSIFTFMLLADTGYIMNQISFYRLNSYESDPLYWGKGRGCDFVQKSCHIAKYPEFCDVKGFGCSYDRNGIGACSYDQLSDKCSYFAIGQGMDCRDSFTKSDNSGYQQFFDITNSDFGFNSKCLKGYIKQIISSLDTDIGYSCYQYECQSDGSINVIVNDIIYDCSKGNVTFSGSDTMNGQLICPSDPQFYCQISNECENQCNQRGFCVNKKCTCQPGYSGASCENECSKYRDGINCVTDCTEQQYTDKYNLLCLNCSGNCLSCDSIDICTKCEDGYYLNQYFCDPLTTVEYGAGLVNPYLNAAILRIIIFIIIIFN